MLEMPGVIASYWHDGDRFRLFGTNAMTGPEKAWWKQHGQELVNTMAAANGPDLIGLLHDRVSYGVYGDHGGAQQSVQRVPMVFWSPSLAFENTTGAPVQDDRRDAHDPRRHGDPRDGSDGRDGSTAVLTARRNVGFAWPGRVRA